MRHMPAPKSALNICRLFNPRPGWPESMPVALGTRFNSCQVHFWCFHLNIVFAHAWCSHSTPDIFRFPYWHIVNMNIWYRLHVRCSFCIFHLPNRRTSCHGTTVAPPFRRCCPQRLLNTSQLMSVQWSTDHHSIPTRLTMGLKIYTVFLLPWPPIGDPNLDYIQRTLWSAGRVHVGHSSQH